MMPPPQVSYWIITPEVKTDTVARAIRRAWLHGAGASAHFCVASGMSRSHDTSLHWLHGLNRSNQVASGRADLNLKLQSQLSSSLLPTSRSPHNSVVETGSIASMVQHETARARELTRIYNNFLRHKVFEIMRDMCRLRHLSEYAFMMDADTAVNRTNLETFVTNLDRTAPLYTGLCKRRSTWTTQQRGVGGGPGILLSRAVLDSICPRLESCAPLRSLMDRLQFAGGDLMLAKCFEFLGHRCNLEKEIPYSSESSILAQGGAIPKLEELFRRGPPWVYPPLATGTILVATRRSAGARAIEMYQRLTSSGLPLTSVISFHRVRPSVRSKGVDKDPRCRVFAEYTRLQSGPAHWTSRCLPNFVLIGTPKSGTTSLFNWVLQHPDMRAPIRKELHFWAPVLTAEKNCADREGCAAFHKSPRPERSFDGGSSQKLAQWPLSKLISGKLLFNYLELFPRLDPRDFAVTGEASPAYMYSPSVALFFESSLAAHIKLLILLRDPAERTFSEFKNKRDLMVKGSPKAKAWINGHTRFTTLVDELRRKADGCSPLELYTACEPCVRFVTAPNPYWIDVSGAQGTLTAPSMHEIGKDVAGAMDRTCVVPPVVWQSWYHLFLPRYLRLGHRLLIEFSDDLTQSSELMMQRVGHFVGLPKFNFSTSVAYNTERRRGAFISNTVRNETNGANGTNTADARSAAAARSTTAYANLHAIEKMMYHSVGQLQQILTSGSWRPPDQQWRRELPAQWIKRYVRPVNATVATP